MTEKEWDEFKAWSKKKYTFWTPDRVSIDLYLEYKKGKKRESK